MRNCMTGSWRGTQRKENSERRKKRSERRKKRKERREDRREQGRKKEHGGKKKGEGGGKRERKKERRERRKERRGRVHDAHLPIQTPTTTTLLPFRIILPSPLLSSHTRLFCGCIGTASPNAGRSSPTPRGAPRPRPTPLPPFDPGRCVVRSPAGGACSSAAGWW
jgi:hypothetical protein